MKKVVRIAFNIAFVIVFILIILVSIKPISKLQTEVRISQTNEIIEGQEVINGTTQIMETGIGIIGLAIAVWAGLNIVNAISRNDIEKVTGELEEKNKKINEMYVSMENINKNEFLKTLLETSDDIMSVYWYNKFKGLECPQDVICKLVVVEQLFSQIYHIHTSVNKNNEYLENSVEDMQNKIDQTFSYILKNRKNMDNEYSLETIQNYLVFREAEGFFYKGYIVDSEEKIYKTYKNAIDGYLDVVGDIVDNFFKFPETYRENEISRENAKIFCYFANTLGESYSKIVQKCTKHKEMEDIAKRAEYYCKNAIKCSEEYECEREIYYRNLGCAYERIDSLEENKFEHSKEILDNYSKALKFIINRPYLTNNETENLYHVYLSYLKKYIEDKLQISYDSYEEIKNLDNVIDNLSINNKDDVQELIKKALEISDFGIKDNIRKSLNVVMYGFSNAYIVLLKHTKNVRLAKEFEEDTNKYLERVKWAVHTLNLMKDTKTYPNQLRKLYEELEKRNEAEKKEVVKKENIKEKAVEKKESSKKEATKKKDTEKKETTKKKKSKKKDEEDEE